MDQEAYPWYEIVGNTEPIHQGDFFCSCPVLVPPTDLGVGRASVEVVRYDIVVMSQSCDLVNGKVDLVLVCPVYTLSESEKENPFLKDKGAKEKLRQGYMVALHLLNRCGIEGHERDFQVIDFRNVYGVPFDTLDRMKGERLRLLPPYREHLSQAFARFFMRVGLPVDVPSFN